MPRHARLIQPNGTYHVTHRGNDRAAIFLDVKDHAKYLSFMRRAKKRYPFELFHYCLMPNHVHLIIRSLTDATISPAMKWIAQQYARYHNHRYKKGGHLWGDRYFSREITDDGYLLTAGVYIDLNPVRAGIIRSAPLYPWSSARFYDGRYRDGLLTPSPAYQALHSDPQKRILAYRDLLAMWRSLKPFG